MRGSGSESIRDKVYRPGMVSFCRLRGKGEGWDLRGYWEVRGVTECVKGVTYRDAMHLINILYLFIQDKPGPEQI